MTKHDFSFGAHWRGLSTIFLGLRMIRWTLTIFIALVIFSTALPWLEKLGIGRLPGDFRFNFFGKTIFLPLASTILLSTLVFLGGRLLK